MKDWHLKFIVYECVAGGAPKGTGAFGSLLERLGAVVAERVADKSEGGLQEALLDLLRRHNVTVSEGAPSTLMGSIQRVGAPLMSTAQDMASNLGASAMRAGGNMATGLQSIRNR